MLAITKTAGLSGICGMEVTVEASAERGLPAYHVIGLGDTAVKESAERVRGAILNSGFDVPEGQDNGQSVSRVGAQKREPLRSGNRRGYFGDARLVQ